MNKTLLLSITCICLLGSTIFGQTIQNSVISSTGSTASSGNVKMDFTLGETVIETFSAGGNTLTQGFHQTNLTLVAIENVELFSEVNVYPNPANAVFNIDIPSGFDMLDIYLYDVLGKLLITQKEVSGLITFDVAHLSTGTYYLQMINSSKNQIKTYKLIKNH